MVVPTVHRTARVYVPTVMAPEGRNPAAATRVSVQTNQNISSLLGARVKRIASRTSSKSSNATEAALTHRSSEFTLI